MWRQRLKKLKAKHQSNAKHELTQCQPQQMVSDSAGQSSNLLGPQLSVQSQSQMPERCQLQSELELPLIKENHSKTGRTQVHVLHTTLEQAQT